MELFRIRTRIIKPNDRLVKIILDSLEKQKLSIQNGDILAIASKVVATTEGRLRKLGSIRPSLEGEKLAKKYGLEPSFVEVVLRESDLICGGVSKALLTLKDNILTVNAGADHKNAPKGYAALWPINSQESAEKIRREIREKTGKQICILIVDSRVTPLRMGTTGFALAAAGFEPVKDYRLSEDLFGNSISITRHAVADDLASAAHILMGESDEQTPIILIRNAPIKLSEKVNPKTMIIPSRKCLYANFLQNKPAKVSR